MSAQIEIAALAIEKLQALHQRGRNDQRRVGVLKWIADHQAGSILNRRREEVEIGAEARKQPPEYRSQALESRLLSETPSEIYQARLNFWRATHARSASRYRQLGNARLATAVAAVAIAAMSIGGGWISAWWLLAPLVIFIALAMIHDRVDRAKSALRARGRVLRAGASRGWAIDWVGKRQSGRTISRSQTSVRRRSGSVRARLDVRIDLDGAHRRGREYAGAMAAGAGRTSGT